MLTATMSQIIEITNVLKKGYDISEFLNFLYIFYKLVIEDFFMLFYNSVHICEGKTNWYNLTNFYLLA